jgi:transcriptional regulator with XRE-family HTH domain
MPTPAPTYESLDNMYPIGYYPSVTSFPQRVRELRRAAGLSQAMLAERTGISRIHVIRIENAQQDPTLGIILRLATALKVKPGALFEPLPTRKKSTKK